MMSYVPGVVPGVPLEMSMLEPIVKPPARVWLPIVTVEAVILESSAALRSYAAGTPEATVMAAAASGRSTTVPEPASASRH